MDASGTIKVANTYFTSNATIYAKWTVNTYTVTCDQQNGSGGTATFYEVYGSKFYTDTTNKTSVTKITVPTRTGYTFGGYYTSTNGSGTQVVDASGTIKVSNTYFTSNTTIYAKWTVNTYTITCDQQNGSGGTATFYEVYGSKFYTDTTNKTSVTKITVPTRTGYTFGGYYTSTNGGGTQVVDASGTIKVANTYFTSNATIYAKWTVNYDVALERIIFKSSLNPDEELTVEEAGQIPYGTVVYVQYVYRNNSPVAVTVTGYDTNGNAITHNGATTYEIAAGETLTVDAGSFAASSLGSGVITGTVYMEGYDNADHEKNNELSGNLAQTNNTRSKSYTIKHDLYVADVYVTHNSANGNVVAMDNLVVGETYYIHVVYGNNAYSSVTAHSFLNGDEVTVNGNTAFTISAQGTVDAAVYAYVPSSTGAVNYSVSLYRNGYVSGTENYESNLSNNIYNFTLTTIPVPELEVIEMNAPYREGTEVITSYWLRNETDRNYPTSDYVIVRMRVYDSSTGTLLKTMTQNVVVPANESQIVYFKWTVPDISESGDFNIIADIQLPWIGMDPDIWLSRVSDNYGYAPWTVYYTPDTEFEGSAPVGWFAVDAPTATKDNASWHQWSCDESGNFYKRNYGITATPGAVTITPDSKTAFKDESGVWHMKSGYGFFVEVSNPAISVTSGYYMPDSGAYTNAQYSFVAYSEFSYSANTDYIDTMEKVSGHWELYEFMEYGRKHHTPIWYPDGSYIIDVCQTDIWTPMGMITVSTPSSAIIIDGDMYDDWYMGHG